MRYGQNPDPLTLRSVASVFAVPEPEATATPFAPVEMFVAETPPDENLLTMADVDGAAPPN